MDLTWPYIAGFFDGEGYVTFSKNRLQAGITQAGDAGLLLLNDIKEFLSHSGILCSLHQKAQVHNHRKCYQLSFSRLQVEHFLKQVFPYLRIKKVVSQDVLRYRTLYPNLMTSPMTRNWRGRDRIKTHCKRGHELSPENVYQWGTQRQCILCVKLRRSGEIK